MAKISLRGRGTTPDIARVINEGLGGGMCSLIDSVVVNTGGDPTYVMVFEKYYMRVSNRASLTVVVAGANGMVTVDAIGTGGGQGMIFRFSWGADEDFAESVARLLEPMGFVR